MTCARNDDQFGRQHTEKTQLVRLSHARETFARAMRARCGFLFTRPVAYKRIAMSGKRFEEVHQDCDPVRAE